MKITSIEIDCFKIPLKRAVSLPAAQDPKSTNTADLLVTRILTDSAHTGFGVTYVLGPGLEAMASVIDRLFKPLFIGQNPLNSEWLFLKAQTESETLGFHGLVSRAYAALDFALWDLKGKVANLPVFQLLGGYRTKLKAVVTDIATPAVGLKQVTADTLAELEKGAAGLQVEVGTLDPDDDADRLRLLREQIPDGAWFEIDAKSRHDFASAIWLGTIGTEEFGLDSYCDPLRGSNPQEFQRLLDRLDVGVCIGGKFETAAEFLPAISQGVISAIRIDPVKLGGITPARKLATLAEVHQISVYPVKLAEVGSHISAGCVYGRMCEYVDWFGEILTGGPRFENQQMVVSQSAGLGLELAPVASKYRM